MNRNNQLTQRATRRKSVASTRGISSTKRLPSIVPRGRIAQKQVLAKRQQEADKKAVSKLIEDIEAGKIKSMSQIPERYRQYIKVTQADLNKINSYYGAKRYESAYNAVMGHYRKGMLWAVAAFGEGLQQQIARKLIKQGYAPSKLALERERKSRSDAIKEITSGNIAGVKIVGNRIIGPGNKPITLSNALKKQSIDNINKTLPVGDKLIVDSRYNIKGISSGVLGQSFGYNQKALDHYSQRIYMSPLAKGRAKTNLSQSTTDVLSSPMRFKTLVQQSKLKKLSKDLPSGVTFIRKNGAIVGIRDKNLATESVGLDVITNYISQAKLIKEGLISKTKVNPFGFLKAYSPSIRRAETEAQRQKYYDLYNLKGEKRNYASLLNEIRISSKTRINKVQEYAARDLVKDLQNPNTAIRAETALLVAALAGGALIGATIGTVYKTPITLARAEGFDTSGLAGLTWKQVAKTSVKEFGKAGVEAYFMMKLFGIGTKLISKSPKAFGYVARKILPKSRVIKRVTTVSGKVFKVGLTKGLDIAAAQYLSSLGKEVVLTGRSFKKKRYKAATVKASKLLGTLAGFYGEKAIKGALRKVMLAEDPRLIITKGTKAKPFAIENRKLTVLRLQKAQKLLKGGKTKYAKASPVKEPRGEKIVTPEKRVARGVKLDVPTPAGYATYEVGNNIYVVPRTFLRVRPGNTPKSYYTKWFKAVKTKGLIPTFKQLGLPKTKSPTVYKGSGKFLDRRKGESLKAYYARGQRTANRLKEVIVVIAPKTIQGSKQPELEIKTIFPNPKGVKASVTRVKVGKDAFGHDIVIESVAPRNIMQRLRFRVGEKIKFKKEALKYLTNREAKIAKDLSKRIQQNYDFIYKSKMKGAADARKHMLQVEKNFRKILKSYGVKSVKGIKITDSMIKSTSRFHDIIKLRGLNVKDEPIIRKALLEGYLNKNPLIKKLNKAQLKIVADTIGFHQDVNPKTLRGARMNKFTRAFINADRLDIVRYGIKVNPKKLFNLKAKTVPQKVRLQFNKLSKLKNTKKWTPSIRKKYNALIKKYPKLGSAEQKIIAENKARWKKMTPKQRAKIKTQERGYTDYLEARRKYKTSRTTKKRVVPYRTSEYGKYKTPKYKAAYRAGYSAGYKTSPKPNSKYRSKYGTASGAYRSGYKAGKSNYKSLAKPRPKNSYKKKPVSKYNITRKKKQKTAVRIKTEKEYKKKTLTKSIPVYYAVKKRKGRMVKLRNKPLTQSDVKDYLSYALDKGLTRQGFYVPAGKARKVVRLPKSIKGYYGKNKYKLRPYKVRMGSRKALVQGYIERSKYALDSPSERGMLAASKRKKIKKKSKKMSATRRKQLLKNLAKARRAKSRKKR